MTQVGERGGERDGGWEIGAALAALGLRTVPRSCARCDRFTAYGMVARLVASASGPGYEVVACLPCARLLATHPDAPDWLVEDLARLDTAPVWLTAALARTRSTAP